MTAPVLYIIFNRLDTVQKSFVPIRSARPEKLYIAADGPRNGKEGEFEKCQQVRDWVLSQIDWECDVKTLFREKNLGCGQGPKQAIDWLFENEEMGIILEDDCVASVSFFAFATEMLERYKNNKQISIVCGSNFDKEHCLVNPDADYFFSKIPYTWGWATWKRNWEGYDFSMDKWNHIWKGRLLSWMFKEQEYREYWRYIFDETVNKNPADIWDYQFFFLCHSRRQYSIVPNYNLISNIGDGDDSTHQFDSSSKAINTQLFELKFPIKYIDDVKSNIQYDNLLQSVCYGRVQPIPFHIQVKRWLKKVIGWNR